MTQTALNILLFIINLVGVHATQHYILSKRVRDEGMGFFKFLFLSLIWPITVILHHDAKYSFSRYTEEIVKNIENESLPPKKVSVDDLFIEENKPETVRQLEENIEEVKLTFSTSAYALIETHRKNFEKFKKDVYNGKNLLQSLEIVYEQIKDGEAFYWDYEKYKMPKYVFVTYLINEINSIKDKSSRYSEYKDI